MKKGRLFALVAAVSFCGAGAAGAAAFNGAGDNGTDAYGYYYLITGGKFPTGPVPNGDNGSGGVFRYVTDDPAWGYPIDTWKKDDWFTDNAGFALTLKNAGATVYDNNGLEDGSYGDYYNYAGSHNDHGLYRGYSMSNNWDWIYAGYFKLTEATTFDTITGYFDANGNTGDPVPFDPYSPSIAYDMNIWSNTPGDLLPVNTGSFQGDVFSSKTLSGTFAVSDTGVARVLSTYSDPIYRLTYTLDAPVTLGPGEYWFSHDAEIAPVPEPGTMALLGTGLVGLLGVARRRMKK